MKHMNSINVVDQHFMENITGTCTIPSSPRKFVQVRTVIVQDVSFM